MAKDIRIPQFRPFDKSDWQCYQGATAFQGRNQPPQVAEFYDPMADQDLTYLLDQPDIGFVRCTALIPDEDGNPHRSVQLVLPAPFFSPLEFAAKCAKLIARCHDVGPWSNAEEALKMHAFR